MGGPASEGGGAEARPLHDATFREGYFLAKYEVVVAAYDACQEAGVCTAPSVADWASLRGLNRTSDGRHDHPQNGLRWQQAREFCAWLAPGGRLPSEAEWEYAATGCVHSVYPWGDAPEPSCSEGNAVFNDDPNGALDSAGCGALGTWPAGSMPAGASAIGALDMAGSLGEWVEDCWHEDYAGAPEDGSAWSEDCVGTSRVLRGGFFGSVAAYVRTAERATGDPDARWASRGARCLRGL